MTDTPDITAQWALPNIIDRIDGALREAGLDPDNLPVDALHPAEHLHSGGIATTRDQAAQAGISEDMHVLDIGCGVGGPARWLATNFGCRVTGIDLTPDFIEAAKVLTARAGLEDKVSLSIGNALELGFPDEAFDLLWCQNVTMNIEDKDILLAGFHRVLKADGLFTFTEFTTGPGGDMYFPVNWARTPEVNFLQTEKEMRHTLVSAGFEILEMENYTATIQRRVAAAAEKAKDGPPNPIGNHLVLGDDVAERGRNTQRNLAEDRLIYWMTTAKKI